MTQGRALLFADCAELNTQPVQGTQEGECLPLSCHGSESGGLSLVLPKRGASVGIMVFSSSCKTLYANQTAFEFLQRLNRRENGHATHGVLPVAVADLFDQMQLLLASRTMNGECERLEARRVLVGQGEAVLLQAFGLRDRLGLQGSRVVITMQDITHPFTGKSNKAAPGAL